MVNHDDPPTDEERTILVVDDEPDVLQSVAATLASAIEDTQIITATSAAEAMTVLSRSRVDLILTDFRMPDVNGLQLLESARPWTDRASKILFTAYPDMDMAIKAINEHRVCKYLTKPPEPEEFIAAVQECLERQTEHRDRIIQQGRQVAQAGRRDPD